MFGSLARTAALLLFVAASAATGAPWETVGPGNGHGEKLTLSLDATHRYIFECRSDAVMVTQTGVTDLLNIGGKGRVSDAPGSVMPDGSAMMALYTGEGDPNFLPAVATSNPVKGWDLTLRIPKNDKALRGLEKAETISLYDGLHGRSCYGRGRTRKVCCLSRSVSELMARQTAPDRHRT
jgi:hypothetical protein